MYKIVRAIHDCNMYRKTYIPLQGRSKMTILIPSLGSDTDWRAGQITAISSNVFPTIFFSWYLYKHMHDSFLPSIDAMSSAHRHIDFWWLRVVKGEWKKDWWLSMDELERVPVTLKSNTHVICDILHTWYFRVVLKVRRLDYVPCRVALWNIPPKISFLPAQPPSLHSLPARSTDRNCHPLSATLEQLLCLLSGRRSHPIFRQVSFLEKSKVFKY